MRSRWPVMLVVVPLLALAVAVMAQPGGTPLALGEIAAPRVAAHVRFLAHDLLEGRAPATRGGTLAAEYIATQFMAAGLEPGAPGGGFLQDVPIVQSSLAPGFSLSAESAAGSLQYRYPDEIVAFSGVERDQVPFQSPVVFVGYGIVAPEFKWNDYQGADVKGKIVMALVNDPPATRDEPELFGGEALTYYGRWTYKFEEAARQGAAGAILVHTTESASYPWQVVQSSWAGAQYALPPAPGEPLLALKAWMTDAASTSLVQAGGQDLDALRTRAATRDFRATPLSVTVAGTLVQTVTRQVSPNVIGLLRGTAHDEAVFYTAHYDHFGTKAPSAGGAADADLIYNGARDNASGVAGIITIAQAFARAGTRPRRSVYFVATTGEESGLLGSEYLAAHPPLPIDKAAAVINVDSLNILGATRDIVLLGATRSSLGETAARLVRAHKRVMGEEPNPNAGSFFRSDHFPLAKRGVPAVSLSGPSQYIGKDAEFARRMREQYTARHYHQPSDEYDDAWDLAGAVEDLRLLAELGWQVAVADTMPAYLPGDQFARPRAQRDR